METFNRPGRILAIVLTTMCTWLNTDAQEGIPTQEAMWRIIQEQQVEIARLRTLIEGDRDQETAIRAEMAQTQAEIREVRTQNAEVQAQVEATALAVEEMAASEGSDGNGWWERTAIGGYGELHANFYEDAPNEIDFHRFVLFVNHSFSDWITLYTELEVEHTLAGDDLPGEVELEQAFVRMDWSQNFSTNVGLFLLPVGVLNEMHEPNTFYGVERNNIESRIIPTTWWEAGVSGNWRFGDGLSFDVAVTSGLDMDPSGVVRSGRQKVAKGTNDVAAFSGRVTYTGIPGIQLGGSAYYQDDVAQTDPADIQGLLTEGHIDFNRGGLRLRALYARWDLDGAMDPAAEEQFGYYIEPSYRWHLNDFPGEVGLFYRFSKYEYYSERLLQNTIHELGINYWPTGNVVFKADIQDISGSEQLDKKGDTAVNVGFGYQF